LLSPSLVVTLSLMPTLTHSRLLPSPLAPFVLTLSLSLALPPTPSTLILALLLVPPIDVIIVSIAANTAPVATVANIAAKNGEVIVIPMKGTDQTSTNNHTKQKCRED